MNTIPVVIVDEHPLIRTSMEKMLRGDPRLVLCGEAGSGDEVVEMCETLSPQFILVGIDALDGTWMSVIGKLRTVQRDAKIVVIGGLRCGFTPDGANLSN